MRLIRVLLALILFALLFYFLYSKNQATNQTSFNGWEFLKWEYDKTKVEEVLSEKGISFDPGAINQKQGPTTEFIYNDMETRLAYDSGHLYDVQQYKYFGQDGLEQAEIFYKKISSELTTKYGNPKTEIYDKDKRETHLSWETKYSKIDLYYNYNGNVVPGLEDSTYTISVSTNERE